MWEDQYKENPFLEMYCKHGYDCIKINSCSCTPEWVVKLNEKNQEERYRLDHNLKRKSKKQKKKEVKRY